MSNFLNGTKFHTYDNDGNLVVKRIVRALDNEMYELKDENGGSKTSTIISGDDLKEKYVLLSPDTLINISCIVDNENVPDVYVCAHRTEDLQNGETRPAVIVRQNVYNDYMNESAQLSGVVSNKLYVGDCRSIIASQSFDYANDFMDIKEVVCAIPIAGYLDDNVQSILKCIPKNMNKDIDQYIYSIYEIAQNILPDAEGYTKSLSEFMTVIGFMQHYRALFNIWTIDFQIELDKRSYNDEGDIILNSKQIKRLEDTVKAQLTDISVLKYDKDIDIAGIVTQKSHIVVCDTTENIYLITYTVKAYYDDKTAGK